MALEDEIINIENLPIANEINFGDFVLLETVQGTKLLDFKDFIIGAENVTFFDRLSGSTFSQVEFDELKEKVENHETILEPISSVNTEITRIDQILEDIKIDILNLKRYESENGYNFIADGVYATYFISLTDIGKRLDIAEDGDIYQGSDYDVNSSFFFKAPIDLRMLFNFSGYMENWDYTRTDTPVIYINKYTDTNERGEYINPTALGNSNLSHINTTPDRKIRFNFNTFAVLNQNDVVSISTVPAAIQFKGDFTFSGVRLD